MRRDVLAAWRLLRPGARAARARSPAPVRRPWVDPSHGRRERDDARSAGTARLRRYQAEEDRRIRRVMFFRETIFRRKQSAKVREPALRGGLAWDAHLRAGRNHDRRVQELQAIFFTMSGVEEKVSAPVLFFNGRASIFAEVLYSFAIVRQSSGKRTVTRVPSLGALSILILPP